MVGTLCPEPKNNDLDIIHYNIMRSSYTYLHMFGLVWISMFFFLEVPVHACPMLNPKKTY